MTKRKTAETQKPRIIQSFYQTIIEEGFENASIAKVAKRIDINSTLILHYFGNKENMTLSLVDYVIEEYAKIFKRLRTQKKEGNPEERMQKFLNAIWSKSYYEKINIAATLSVVSVSFRNPRIKKKINSLYQQFTQLMVHELKELEALNVIKTKKFERTAVVLISMIEGARHFHPFLTKAKDLKQYNQDMTMAAIQILKATP